MKKKLVRAANKSREQRREKKKIDDGLFFFLPSVYKGTKKKRGEKARGRRKKKRIDCSPACVHIYRPTVIFEARARTSPINYYTTPLFFHDDDFTSIFFLSPFLYIYPLSLTVRGGDEKKL